MAMDWSVLRQPAPGTLGAAREVAHWAVQWPARAARANLAPAADDSHSALGWDAGLGALLSAPLAAGTKADARVGVQLALLELIVMRSGRTELLQLEGCTPGTVNDWLDLKLKALGLKPASGAKLPYEVAPRPLQSEPGLAALARWFGAAADVLEEVRAKTARFRPGPGPVRLWPHHFDLALRVSFDIGGGESARSIGIGVSPGDGYYPQPYAYVSPYPAPRKPKLPALPPGAHWHTKDFFGAVASAEELLAQPDPRAALVKAIDAAFEAAMGWLHA
ncbi:MAG TPA: hypothetical protein VLX30_01250 [Burkholderiales bacterium]|nr:hypothetical protein [Burkholderiales bacterium]